MKSALSGLRVVEFGWVLAGPLITQYLAHFGAEVIKIESVKRRDRARTSTPYKDGVPGTERSGVFAHANGGKLSLTLNLNSPRGIEIARKLVNKSDIVVENFRPGVIDRLGLGYKDLKQVKNDIIMVSISILGRGGAYDQFGGFAPHGAAASGYFDLTGWPDREPTSYLAFGPGDWVIAPFAVLGIMAALDRKRRTGVGEYIDCNQSEVFASLLSAPYLQYAATGNEPVRAGNRDPRAAPHGAFRCRGDDKWCAIAVFGEDEWRRFAGAIGSPAWTGEERFATLAARKQHEDELEKLVEEWTRQQDADEAVGILQRAGVKAAAMAGPEFMMEADPQLKARNYFEPAGHPVLGEMRYPRSPARLSLTPAAVKSSPCLGEHNEYVCCGILGMSDSEFAALAAEGVLE